jgi:hypothetical protein
MAEQAEAAQKALLARLGGKLGEAMSAGGPAGAISVCAEDAPRMAAAVSQEFGVSIGRTSFRLRNPANSPPAWAEALVEKRETKLTYLGGPNGELGMLKPIHMMNVCETCHGDPAGIPSDVGEAIAQRYAEDQAVGFAAGDLRGWFWVEVPAQQ